MQTTQTKPNGPVAASFLAAGIASLVFGVLVVLSEASADFGSFLAFDKNYGLGSGVGALSGKAILGSLALVISWVVLHFMWRGKEVNFNRVFMVALIFVAAGFLLTFPPVFDIFVPKAG